MNIGGSRLQYTLTGGVVTLGRPVPGMLTVHDQGLLVEKALSRPAGAGLGQAKRNERYSQNQVSRCHTHSGIGNWHNVR